MRAVTRLTLPLAALALVGASPIDRETKPGEGVLCLGGFIYFAQLEGKVCHSGKDDTYQKRLDGYVERLDAYLIRNFPDGKAGLEYFKVDEGMTLETRPDICSSYKVWDHLRKTPAAKFDAQVDKLLERDGRPTFGDCV